MVNHIDDSRERPERGVSDTIREKGGFTDDPHKSGVEKAMEDTTTRVVAANQNSGKSDSTNDDKDDRDTRHNKLKSAIERTEDAADAER